MAYLGITASADGLLAAGQGEDLQDALHQKLCQVPASAPVVVLVHGYKFHPGRPGRDPHRLIYAYDPERSCWKTRSWPKGLGIRDDDGETGLAIGFAWPAGTAGASSCLRTRRTSFGAAYDRAAEYGRRLAEVIRLIRGLDPARQVDILAHSLGARVALSALPHLETAPGRMILLGAAEFDARACEFLKARRAPEPPQVYNITARANDFYDAMFETFAPRRSWGERAVGLGLNAQLPNWLDIQLDRADVTDWVNAQGIALRQSQVRFCHWSFYTRAGAFDLYAAILRRRPGWDISTLRTAPCLASQEPRWCRLVPVRRPRPAPMQDPAGIGSDFRSA